jgi:hypothetical protein
MNKIITIAIVIYGALLIAFVGVTGGEVLPDVVSGHIRQRLEMAESAKGIPARLECRQQPVPTGRTFS